mgnify:CR=1 FL=1
MLIFDGDFPMAYGALELNRDLTHPLETIRQAKASSENVPFACLPEMRRGGVATALVKFAARRLRDGSLLPSLRSAEAVYGSARGQVAYYQALAECGEATILTTGHSISEHTELWEHPQNPQTMPVGFVLGMEGADPILWPEQIHHWFDLGVRVVSLTHYGPSSYAHGTGTTGGLLGQAEDLLQEMGACGMLLDLTHLAEKAFYETIDIYTGPVLASHQNCQALVPGERQFTDEQLRIVIERDGVIGASMDTWMLYPDSGLCWAKAGSVDRRTVFPRTAVTLEHVADHIQHVCELSGNSLHAAIGGDTDGQGGLEGAPNDVDTVADYGKIGPILKARGFADEDVENILYRNWQRFYEKNLPN